MNFLDRLNISDQDKRKILDMGISDEAELVGQIRASEDVARSHFGDFVVNEALAVFAAKDKGKLEELPGKLGLFLTEPKA